MAEEGRRARLPGGRVGLCCHCEPLYSRVKQSRATFVYGEMTLIMPSMQYEYAVYMMANERNTVIYTGVTNDLPRRVYEHASKITKGFTKKYNVNKLVYVEYFQDINEAIAREKNIKAGSRKKKEELITDFNAEWKDLSDAL